MDKHPALDRFEEYLRVNKPPDGITYYMYYLLESITEGSLKEINVCGNKYEVHADLLETEE